MNEAQQLVDALLEDNMPIGNYVNFRDQRRRTRLSLRPRQAAVNSAGMIPTVLASRTESEEGELYQMVVDGQRAYRLRSPVSACPPFENEAHRRAWKAGYYSARDGVSPRVALSTLQSDSQPPFDVA